MKKLATDRAIGKPNPDNSLKKIPLIKKKLASPDRSQ